MLTHVIRCGSGVVGEWMMKTDRQVRHPFLDLWVNALCLLMLAGYVRRHASEGCSSLQCILAVTPFHAPSLNLHVTSKSMRAFPWGNWTTL